MVREDPGVFMVRILHLLDSLRVGGKERVALRLARTAIASGMDAELVLFDHPVEDPSLDLDPGSVRWTHYKRRGGLDLKLVRRLARHLRTRSVDLVQTYNDAALVYGTLAARLSRRKVRVVATFHSRPTHATRPARIMSRWSSRLAHAVLAVSPDLAEHLRQDGWVTRCDVIENGIDLGEYRPDGPTDGWRDRLGIPAGAFVLGHAGRLQIEKQHDVLLDAFGSLRRTHPDVHLICVGDGERHDVLQARITADPHIHWVPRVHDMASWYREVDVFALCSRAECCPLVIIEAMASGLPCVVTRAGHSAPMIGVTTADDGIAAGPCGLAVSIGDGQSLASAIASLVDDAKTRRAMAVAARRRAVLHYGKEREWERYAALYRST